MERDSSPSRFVLGAIDTPAEQTTTVVGPLTVRGWAWSTASPVSRVEILFNEQSKGTAGLFRARSDVARYLQDERAELSGFEFRTHVQSVGLEAEHIVVGARVWLLDGRSEELPTVRVFLDTAPAQPEPKHHMPAPVPCRRPISDPIRLLCFARSLDHGGSQLRMKTLLRHLRQTALFDVTVLSPADGPLRTTLEAFGVTVLIKEMPVHEMEAYLQALDEITAWATGRFDVVLAFTLTSFPGVDVARSLGLPSVWRIGEDAPVRTVCEWLGQQLDPQVEQRSERAFSSASVVAFISENTLQAHQRTDVEENFLVLRNGVDVAAATTYLRQTTQEQCRARLGIDVDARMLICAATLWPIKGQALLISAMKQAVAKCPQLQCVLIGQQVSPYAELLPRMIDREGLSGAVCLVPYCDDLRPWWRAADIVVCPSETEALSTSVLEGMSFGLPALVSRVGGMPEAVQAGVNGWLCEPNDLGAWIAALSQAAATGRSDLRRMGNAAMAHVASHYSLEKAMSRTARLLADVAAQGPTGRRN